MGPGTLSQEAGPHVRRPKALKTKLAQGWPEDSSSLRSNGSYDGCTREAGPRERWSKTLKEELENNSRKQRDLIRQLA